MFAFGCRWNFLASVNRRYFSKFKMSNGTMIAVAQMNCAHDLEENFKISESLIRKSKASVPSVKMIFFPECFDYIATSSENSVANAIDENGEYINRFRSLAQEQNIWISLGGFHEKTNIGKTHNSHLIIDSNGATVAKYRKAHLFDIDIKNKVRVKETDFTIPGEKILLPVKTPIGNIGLSTCYDLRFPEMSTILRKNGAQILTYPSAFTLITGMAHWEVLLRSQAITNQCYVIAAAQTGKHNEKRMSYGHAMVVDPWGTIVAQCSEGNNVCFAEINLDYLNTVREQLPCFEHKRHDLYSLTELENSFRDCDSETSYVFGHNVIPSSNVFLRSTHCYAFVNRKPVVLGHILISSIRKVEKFTELNQAEVADIFKCVQTIQKKFEDFFKCSSTTICIQDGPDSGQTVKHVHVHLLPRRADDLDSNDDIYVALAKHDKTEEGFRNAEDMANEAKEFRKLFYSN